MVRPCGGHVRAGRGPESPSWEPQRVSATSDHIDQRPQRLYLPTPSAPRATSDQTLSATSDHTLSSPRAPSDHTLSATSDIIQHHVRLERMYFVFLGQDRGTQEMGCSRATLDWWIGLDEKRNVGV